jgi:hypothetical protein
MKVVLLLLAAAAVFGMFAGSTEPVIGPLQGTAIEPILHALHSGNSIVFNLSVGYLSSFIFWLLVVHYPEVRRRALLRDNLALQYHNFKESVIQILLWCSVGSHDSELPKQLCDHLKFKEFFSGNEKQHWYGALNGLQDQQDHMRDLLFELELLSSEVAYVLNNVSIQDANVHQSLKFLNEHIFRLKNSSVYSGNPVKYIGNFIWGILARWSFITGQRQEDFIEEVIKKL